ncbi:MAG TPA: rod shape-determining protein MreC [Candidatus Acidoferrales bacterium]|nr:rod shape-determining protein MreC [Candidatus Acidoferrales bacterium]
MDVTSRQRPIVLLVAVILAQVLLLAFQIKRERDVSLVRVWSVDLITPLENAGTYVMSKIGGVWTGYIGLRHTEVENQKLAEQVAQLKLRNQQLEGQAAEVARLSKLLAFRQENASVQMVAAEVIGASADSSSHTIFINRGEHDGLKRSMAVITPDGVVGRIYEVLGHVSQVLLITDKESGVGALLADTRAHGVVNGAGETMVRMDYVRGEEKVTTGERILTSGEDRIFPKDLLVGTVASTKPGFPFQTVEVEPAAHLDRLEEVLVLETQQPLASSRAEEASIAPANEAIPPSALPKPNEAAKPAASAGVKPPQKKSAVVKAEAPKSPSKISATPDKKPGGEVTAPSENPAASAPNGTALPDTSLPVIAAPAISTPPASANPATPNPTQTAPAQASPDATKPPAAKPAAPKKKPDDKKKPPSAKPPGPGTNPSGPGN